MKVFEIEVKVAMARREMQYWQEIIAKKSCNDCQNYQRGGCTQAGGANPPAQVIKTGCPEWNWDEIPF